MSFFYFFSYIRDLFSVGDSLRKEGATGRRIDGVMTDSIFDTCSLSLDSKPKSLSLTLEIAISRSQRVVISVSLSLSFHYRRLLGLGLHNRCISLSLSFSEVIQKIFTPLLL